MKSKVADENGSRRIIYLTVGMASGLKILVSDGATAAGGCASVAYRSDLIARKPGL
jgi:hypothetical protein